MRGMVLILLVAGIPLAMGADPGTDSGPRAIPTTSPAPATLDVLATDLKQTIVTPVLEQKLEPGRNVLWCCTFQFCWSDLCTFFGHDFPEADAPPVVALLNRKEVTKDVLDQASYVAMAGVTGGGTLDKIKEALALKFGDNANPRLLSHLDRVGPGNWFAYAYLLKHLPFKWAFTRFAFPMGFGGRNVAAFGIYQYLRDQPDEVKMATQVATYDYRSNEDFIVELKTVSADDRLFLARVPPGETLAATVADVRRRVSESKPGEMQEMENLEIPVMDFDITKDYPELSAVDVELAEQRTRFRLDEKGAVLESEGLAAGGLGRRDFVFDGPFLILLERRGAAAPYFALWVANPELLQPMLSQATRKLALWEATDADLAQLDGLTGLQQLDLSDSKVTDAGLVHLKGLTGLQDLRLTGTHVTDAGLVHLRGLTALRRLALGRTRVSDAGVEQLKKCLPELEVYR